MGLKPIPTTRVRTALGLCRAVKRAVLAEPKRVDMGGIVAEVEPEDGGPACGTTGCFAGWICLLHDGRERALLLQSIGRAERILGPGVDFDFRVKGKVEEDGSPTVFDVFNSGEGDTCFTTTPGTRAHARAVANRIDRFIARNRKALMRNRVRPIGLRRKVK